MLVPGLDRLDGSLLAGMPDDLWSAHSAEIQAAFAAAIDAAAADEDAATAPVGFDAFCTRYCDGTASTDAMTKWAAVAPPLAVIWDSDGTLVRSSLPRVRA